MGETYLNVGKIVNTHGIRGELKVLPTTDFPDIRFARGSELVVECPLTGRRQTVRVERARRHRTTYIVKFEGLDHIGEAERHKGCLLKVSERHRAPLSEGEFYFHDIIGCRVVDESGVDIGVVTEILQPGANDVWVVERPQGKPILLPYIDDVVLGVDVKAKRVTVRLMEGLAD
ncbi:MAG: ribosome maturation factor RimM [Candidatus Reconcilbacillus cellulovorans]|uniref:Ribosome maturation factor RimM n=1 Tax=Candidatus Reconcilbacillus cellulovorans TaxID=1906605 RepID=A0A2A6E319_9BACL|nr:MAG: ribosome maturation factor RimM [Candidatus Reconcilbacillus cellulovorans]